MKKYKPNLIVEIVRILPLPEGLASRIPLDFSRALFMSDGPNGSQWLENIDFLVKILLKRKRFTFPIPMAGSCSAYENLFSGKNISIPAHRYRDVDTLFALKQKQNGVIRFDFKSPSLPQKHSTNELTPLVKAIYLLPTCRMAKKNLDYVYKKSEQYI
jgi:hypothetical protein